jgi:hypothetical protein
VGGSCELSIIESSSTVGGKLLALDSFRVWPWPGLGVSLEAVGIRFAGGRLFAAAVAGSEADDLLGTKGLVRVFDRFVSESAGLFWL